MCGLLKHVVSHGSGLSRKVLVYYTIVHITGRWLLSLNWETSRHCSNTTMVLAL